MFVTRSTSRLQSLCGPRHARTFFCYAWHATTEPQGNSSSDGLRWCSSNCVSSGGQFPQIPRATPGQIKGKTLRHQMCEIHRQNRRSPEKEELARKGKLRVPLNEVEQQWREGRGPWQLQRAAQHCQVFRDVYGESFLPQGFFEVTYQYQTGDETSSMAVHRGNIIRAEEAVHRPSVVLPDPPSSGHLWSLVLSNPDGHLLSNTHELLHWMVVNIPGSRLEEGEEVFPYLPPVPPRGTGLHRYVYSLYHHSLPLKVSQASVTSAVEGASLGSNKTWLDRRTFSTRNMLSQHPSLQVFSLCFHQTQWDQSVHKTYTNVLDWPEPLYDVEKYLSPRQIRKKLKYQQRQERFKD